MSIDLQKEARENPPFIALNSDGVYTRYMIFPSSEPTPNHDSNTLVLSKDVPINHIHKTGLRIYLPKDIAISTTKSVSCDHTSTNAPDAISARKLPVIVFYPGGGFVVYSPATIQHHEFCNQLANQLSVIVVSVYYRLAPEHRLPAAYEDGVEVLHWLKSSQDPWLTKFGDLSNCYIMGNSAGANIAYNVGLRVSKKVIQELLPLTIKGFILHHLFIGGVDRVASEIRLAEAGVLTPAACDRMWALCLPIGANRDHEYCNPLVGGDLLDEVVRFKDLGWPVLVACCYDDLMIDRQVEFAKTLELKGVETKCYFGEGGHAEDLEDKSKAKKLLDAISNFMVSTI